MSDKQALKLAKILKKDVQKGFGKRVCKELHFDCPNCKAQALVGHLNWYIDLLEWSLREDRKIKKSYNMRKKR